MSYPAPNAQDTLDQGLGEVIPVLGGDLLALWRAGDVGLHFAKASTLATYIGGGTFTQSGTGAAARTMQDKVRESWSLRDFGCVLDGVTDDTANALKAFAAAKASALLMAGPGRLLHPGGTMLISAALTDDGSTDLIFQGNGWGQSVILCNTAGVIPIDWGIAGSDSVADRRLLDIHIQGNGSTSHGVRWTRLHGLIDGCRVDHHGGSGILMDRCYASHVTRTRCSNNTLDGINLGPGVAGIGNDDIHVDFCGLLANGRNGFWVQGSASGVSVTFNDIEGNLTGIKLDCGTDTQNESVICNFNYFESQVGKNVEMGSDSATRQYWGFSFRGNEVNPGTGSATTNQCLFQNFRGLINGQNKYNVSNIILGGATGEGFEEEWGNRYNGCTGIWPAGTAPAACIMFGTTGGLGMVGEFLTQGWGTGYRRGFPESGANHWQTYNWLPTGSTTGTQDQVGSGSSGLLLSQNYWALGSVAVGAGAGGFINDILKDANGVTVKALKTEVFATGALPAAGAANDGRMVLENVGVGDRNLIIYANGQRFRIDGGAAF